MIQVHLKNYTTVKDAKFDIQGLTVLRATSNSGKSNVVEAISAGCSAEFLPTHLRWGESVAEIELRFHDGVVKLTRTGSSTTYQIITASGLSRSYAKLNRKLPDEVVSFLNLCILSIGDSPYCVNFHKQFALPLSLAMSHNKFVSFLSSSDLLEEHKAVGKKLSTKAYELQGSVNSFSSLLATTQTQLDEKSQKLRYFTALGQRIDAEYQKVSKLYQFVSAVASIGSKLLELSELRRQKGVCVKEERLVEAVLNRYTEGVCCQKSMSALSALSAELSDLSVMKVALMLASTAVDKIDAAVLAQGVMSSTQKRLTSLSDVSVQLKSLTSLEAERFTKSELLDSLSAAYDKYVAVVALKEKITRLGLLSNSVSQSADLTKSRDEKQVILDNNLCPLCAAPLGSHTH